MTIRAILRLIRFPNLLVVALTQVLLGSMLYKLIAVRDLSDWSFGLLILTTVFIAAAGYVINDIYDSEIDLINKPDKVVVGKVISPKQASNVYWVFVIVGFLMAVYLAWMIQDFKQLLIYPFATFLLWAYAKKLKKSFVIGNVVVAAYCAFVPGIILYAERAGYASLAQKSKFDAEFIGQVFLSYALMAFLTTVWREVVKDMEDVEGDKAHGAATLPVKHGILLAQKIAMLLGVGVMILIFYYLVYLFELGLWNDFAYLIVVFILVVFIIFMLRFREVKSLHRASQLIKIVMVLGLGYLFFL